MIAGITLLLVCLWLLRTKSKKIAFAVFPAIFMLVTSFAALVLLVINENLLLIRAISFVFIVLTFMLVWAVNAEVNLVNVVSTLLKKGVDKEDKK